MTTTGEQLLLNSTAAGGSTAAVHLQNQGTGGDITVNRIEGLNVNVATDSITASPDQETIAAVTSTSISVGVSDGIKVIVDNSSQAPS
jgi:hypothetical protein